MLSRDLRMSRFVVLNALYRVHKPRVHPRFNDRDYRLPGFYHIVTNTIHRIPILGSLKADTVVPSQVGEVADDLWRAIETHYSHVRLVEHITMPDHTHTLIEIFRDITRGHRLFTTYQKAVPGSVPVIVRDVKSAITRISRQRGFWPKHQPIWQPSFYETVIEADRVQSLRAYIRNNPKEHSE